MFATGTDGKPAAFMGDSGHPFIERLTVAGCYRLRRYSG